MDQRCPECGAEFSARASCLDLFHELLALESEVPGAPGSIRHFYAVMTYALQHPVGMGYRAEMLEAGLRALGDALDGRADVAELRRRARAADGPTRILRRADEPVPDWPGGPWAMNVADVLAAGVEGYSEAVASWARAVRDRLRTASR